MVAIPDLLTVIRDLGRRSEGIRQLVSDYVLLLDLITNIIQHIEAVHRLLRFNCGHILNQVDIEVFQRYCALHKPN
jgi:hypothetical protein